MGGLRKFPTLDEFKILMKEDAAFNEHFSAFLQLPVSGVEYAINYLY